MQAGYRRGAGEVQAALRTVHTSVRAGSAFADEAPLRRRCASSSAAMGVMPEPATMSNVACGRPPTAPTSSISRRSGVKGLFRSEGARATAVRRSSATAMAAPKGPST